VIAAGNCSTRSKPGILKCKLCVMRHAGFFSFAGRAFSAGFATAPRRGPLLARIGARLRTGAPRSRRPVAERPPPGPEAPNNVGRSGHPPNRRAPGDECPRGGNGRALDCRTFPRTVLENKHRNKHSTPRAKTGKLKGVLHLLEWWNWQTHGTQKPEFRGSHGHVFEGAEFPIGGNPR
jgi:hypothetical protein